MDLARSLPSMMSFMGTSFHAKLPCVWLPGHAPWKHPVRCTAVAWRPARRAACQCNLPLLGAGPVVFALVKPGEELRVCQEFFHPGLDGVV